MVRSNNSVSLALMWKKLYFPNTPFPQHHEFSSLAASPHQSTLPNCQNFTTMSWDCYCAICGGPFERCQFRTIKKAQGAKPKAAGSTQGDSDQTTDAGNGDENGEEPSNAEEEDSEVTD